MQNAWNRFKENALAIGVLVAILTTLGAFAQYAVVNPIHQRFDDLRADLNTRFETQDKLINQRFDDLKDGVDQRFDAQDKRIDDLKDGVNQRFDAVDQRLERLENDMSELRRLSERVSENSIRIDTIERQLTTADTPPSAD